MVAQIDEQEIAVVALAVNPAGNADLGADILRPKLAAVVGSIGVHRSPLRSVVNRPPTGQAVGCAKIRTSSPALKHIEERRLSSLPDSG